MVRLARALGGAIAFVAPGQAVQREAPVRNGALAQSCRVAGEMLAWSGWRGRRGALGSADALAAPGDAVKREAPVRNGVVPKDELRADVSRPVAR